MGRTEIQEFSLPLYHYIAHLHIAISGFIAATGLATAALAWYRVRRGELWAYVTAIAAPVLGLAVALPAHYPYHLDTLGHLGLIYLATAVFVVGAVTPPQADTEIASHHRSLMAVPAKADHDALTGGPWKFIRASWVGRSIWTTTRPHRWTHGGRGCTAVSHVTSTHPAATSTPMSAHALAAARAQVANLIGAEPDNIVFTASGSRPTPSPFKAGFSLPMAGM